MILECFSCPDFIHPNTQRKVLSDLTSTNTDPSLASSREELKLSFREIFSQEHFCCNSVHASFKGVALVMCYCLTKSCYIIIMSDSKFVKIDQYYVKCFFFCSRKVEADYFSPILFLGYPATYPITYSIAECHTVDADDLSSMYI